MIAGDIHDSDNKYFSAIKAMLTQKLLVVRTQMEIAGMAKAPPNKQTSAFVMRLFFSYLSLTRPPITVERKPQLATISAL